MKKNIVTSIVITIIIVIILAVLGEKYLGNKVAARKTQMSGHNVVNILKSRYILNEAESKEVDYKLTQLDALITESFNEAILSGEANKQKVLARSEHMQRVGYLAIELMTEYEKSTGESFTLEQATDLLFAAYLHDIRKLEEGNHAKNGEKYVEQHIRDYIDINDADVQLIGTMIKYHSDMLTDKQREKVGDYAILIEILQDADTADKILNRGEDDEENRENINLESSLAFIERIN